MQRTLGMACLPVLLVLTAFPGAAQAGLRDDPRLLEIAERIERLADRLKDRKEQIEAAGEAVEQILLEEHETDLTEYEALDLDRYLSRDRERERSRECARARRERAEELRHREEELRRARASLAEAENERERENARNRIRLQREHLYREVERTREILRRICGEEPPGEPREFIPPGHLKARGRGHHFAPGTGHEKFDPDHEHGSDEWDHPGKGKGKGKKKGKKKG